MGFTFWDISKNVVHNTCERKNRGLSISQPPPKKKKKKKAMQSADELDALRQTVETALLQELDKAGKIASTAEFAKQNGFDHNLVVGVVKKFESHGLISSEVINYNAIELTPEGQEALAHGSPEARLWQFIDPVNGIPKAVAEVRTPQTNIFFFGPLFAMLTQHVNIRNNPLAKLASLRR